MLPQLLSDCIKRYQSCIKYKDSGTIRREPLNGAMVPECYSFETDFVRGQHMIFSGKAGHKLDYIPLGKHHAFVFVRNWMFSMTNGTGSFSGKFADGTTVNTDVLEEAIDFANASSREAFSVIPAMLLSPPQLSYFKFSNYVYEAAKTSTESTEYRCESPDASRQVRILLDPVAETIQQIEVTEFSEFPTQLAEILQAAQDHFANSNDTSTSEKVQKARASLFGTEGAGLRTVYSYSVDQFVPGENH